MVELYEKLGLFYVGQDVDRESMAATGDLTLLKNTNFTTHAAIIGMTGSGKTGLGIGLIEEAAIDNIPSIVIDPKGDMGNLLLTDPTFSPEVFRPWVADEARAKGKQPLAYAKQVAQMWKEGLASHHQDASRVETFGKVDKAIYTPGSSAGISVNVLSSLDAPPAEIMDDSDLFASTLSSTVSSLLALVGIEANPVESREYILIAQILSNAWIAGESLSLEDLIGRIISPSFRKIGVLPLDDFYPREKRFNLATRFNSVIASPTFSAWLEGETLDIQRMLYDEEGNARIAIFSIAHLSDAERMFFVTLLLNRYIAWMRRQSGSGSLKTLLYMDEIFGFFPPVGNPPSKQPMLLLLKQARAFGVGIILSTQNPVDLDYKGLSNIGTWFIGRLQTRQDIERVIDGLGDKTGSSFDRKEIAALLANLKKRVFFLKSAHLDDIRLFSTRWVLSYLKGPLKRADIAALMADRKPPAGAARDKQSESVPRKPQKRRAGFDTFVTLDNSITQLFRPALGDETGYRPGLLAHANLHYFSQARSIDLSESLCLSLPLLGKEHHLDWGKAEKLPETQECLGNLPTKPPSEIRYAPVPDIVAHDRNLSKAARELSEWIYRTHRLELYRVRNPKLESRPGESLGDFKVRINDLLSDRKEAEIGKLKERYAKKEKTLLDRLDRAMTALDKEKSDSTGSLIKAGITVLGVLFGKSRASVGTAGTRVLKERGDISRAEERVQKIQMDIDALEAELWEKIDELDEQFNIEDIDIEEFSLKLRKTDIDIDQIALVWSTD
ncbi:MAG: DUF87 domain-containing protein [Chromatiales bacterium]|jgi:hypothetical protein